MREHHTLPSNCWVLEGRILFRQGAPCDIISSSRFGPCDNFMVFFFVYLNLWWSLVELHPGLNKGQFTPKLNNFLKILMAKKEA